MKLTNRLQKIASLVSKGKKVADIGTDHGYIPVYLLNEGIINEAILADINKGPLENAKSEVEKNNLISKVQFRLGSGLNVLKKGEVDEVIIAGMGGVLISEILEEQLDLCKTFDKIILQPMQAQEVLREYLYNNNFEILDEHLVNEDFRVYEIIEVKYSEDKVLKEIDKIYFEISEKLIEKKDLLLFNLLDKKIRECNSILDKLKDIDEQNIIGRKKEVIDRKEKLEKIKESIV